MGSPRLRIESGDARGREVELTRPFVIGRAQSCDLVLNDESCSRMHVRITPEGPRGAVEDLGSTNGTLVNGERITTEFVEDGDTIVVGGTTLRFCGPEFDGGATVVIGNAAREDADVVKEVAPDAAVRGSRGPKELLDATSGLIDATRGTPERRAVARALCEQIGRVIRADRVAVLLFRAGSPDPRDAELVSVPELRLDPTRPWIEQAMSTRQALLLEDTKSGKRPLHGLVVPVHHGEGPQLLVYADRRKDPFLEDDLSDALQLIRVGAALHQTALRHQRVADELAEHRSRSRQDRRIVGESPSHQEVVNAVRRTANGNQSVLFIGEAGTGKELFARLLHDLSPRSHGRFVSVNCSVVPEGLLEVEVFGAESAPGPYGSDRGDHIGALERAQSGTLFLDEIDVMDLQSQARLAKVLRDRRFMRGGTREIPLDIRLVAASDRNLSSRAQTGTFHEDLLALLALGTVPVPPLRERPEDIPLLADHFIKTHARRMNRTARRLSGDALKTMRSYEWPGNVRELSNVIERAVMLSNDEEIGSDLLPFAPRDKPAPEDLSLVAVEKLAVERALEYCNYRKGQAAKVLGISWPTLNKKIVDYGIQLPNKP